MLIACDFRVSNPRMYHITTHTHTHTNDSFLCECSEKLFTLQMLENETTTKATNCSRMNKKRTEKNSPWKQELRLYIAFGVILMVAVFFFSFGKRYILCIIGRFWSVHHLIWSWLLNRALIYPCGVVKFLYSIALCLVIPPCWLLTFGYGFFGWFFNNWSESHAGRQKEKKNEIIIIMETFPSMIDDKYKEAKKEWKR